MQAARGASLTTSDRGSRYFLLSLAVGVAAWGVDQVTKVLAVDRLDPSDPHDLVGSLLRLHLTRNPGAAFSSGSGLTPWISAFAVVALVVVVVLARRTGDTVWAWAMGLLVAGIAGNLTDRLLREPGPMRGHVVDFLELPHWPIFNVADICINVAAGLIILQSLRGVRMSGGRAEDDR
jgi:signal peptidase II